MHDVMQCSMYLLKWDFSGFSVWRDIKRKVLVKVCIYRQVKRNAWVQLDQLQWIYKVQVYSYCTSSNAFCSFNEKSLHSTHCTFTLL